MDIDHKHIHTLFLNYKHGYDRNLQGKIWHILHMQVVYSSRPVFKKKITNSARLEICAAGKSGL
jgi:hypothetical protein